LVTSSSPTDGCVTLASPKSSTFTNPSEVAMMLVGFKSRCTIPAWCAFASVGNLSGVTQEMADRAAQAKTAPL
jgi:hypothetical protein